MQLPSASQRAFFEQAAAQYQSDLAGDTAVQAYLTSRGLTARDAATFRLGKVGTPLRGHERYAGRLCIPYLTPSGVITLRFRCLQDHVCKDTIVGYRKDGSPRKCPKYLGLEGEEATLYNVLDFRKESQAVYICEGEIDTISLSLSGFPAIGMPGVKQWKPFFAKCFSDYTHIFCVADGDEAGHQMGRLLTAELKARTIRPPAGRDVNDIFKERGPHGIREWLAGATG